MATVMKASEFVKKVKDVAKNYKTLYVKGCFGSPLTSANKARYTKNHTYNKQATRTAMINAASSDTFGFDCVCLIKGILWGWNGDKSKTYGGASYGTNGVPDINADAMIKKCSNISTDFSKIEVGEAVWCSGHIGVYIGDGLAVECTPKWKNNVQITACNCSKSGYNRRNWTKHGKLPYIQYDVTAAEKSSTVSTSSTAASGSALAAAKADYAEKLDKSLAGKYKVTAKSGLNIRAGASTAKKNLGVIKYGATVTNSGYYSVDESGTKWLYVASGSITGFCSSKYLKKC